LTHYFRHSPGKYIQIIQEERAIMKSEN
jgi:hypothetical protein